MDIWDFSKLCTCTVLPASISRLLTNNGRSSLCIKIWSEWNESFQATIRSRQMKSYQSPPSLERVKVPLLVVSIFFSRTEDISARAVRRVFHRELAMTLRFAIDAVVPELANASLKTIKASITNSNPREDIITIGLVQLDSPARFRIGRWVPRGADNVVVAYSYQSVSNYSYPGIMTSWDLPFAVTK